MGAIITELLIGAVLTFLLSGLYLRYGSNENLKGLFGWFFLVPSFATCLYLSVMVIILYVIPIIF